MSRTLMIRCVLHSSKLSRCFGGYAIIIGDIYFDLVPGKGQKSCEIVEISTCFRLPISGIYTCLSKSDLHAPTEAFLMT